MSIKNKTTSSKHSTLINSVIIAFLALAGCSTSESPHTGLTQPSASLEHSNSGDALDRIDNNMNRIRQDFGFDSTVDQRRSPPVSSVAKLSIPDDLPADVPIFPEAVPTLILSSKLKTIRLETTNHRLEVHTFYVRELRKLGWELTNDAALNIQARKAGGRIINIDLIEDSPLVLSLQYN